MGAIGPELFPGQHRGTGAGLQNTCSRFAAIVVNLLYPLLPSFSFFQALILTDDWD